MYESQISKRKKISSDIKDKTIIEIDNTKTINLLIKLDE